LPTFASSLLYELALVFVFSCALLSVVHIIYIVYFYLFFLVHIFFLLQG
jgi:hypothetical protein